MSVTLSSHDRFERDATTWLAYLMLGYVAFAPNALGPLMPFLRSELQLSYAEGGLLISAVACGMILSGLTADRLAGRWGRGRVLWGGATASGLAALCLAWVDRPAPAILCALIIGYGTSLAVVMIQAILSDRHGEHRAIALTESNVLASASPPLAPLLIGGFQRLGVGWRGVLVLPAVMLALIALGLGRTRVPATQQTLSESGTTGRRALPLRFWVLWLVIVLVVSVEWALIVWGADYLEQTIGLSKVNASTAMSVFLGAMLLGRVIGSRLTRAVPPVAILLLAFCACLLGFAVFWLARLALLNLSGLFLAGLGAANLFPLSMSLAVGTAPQHADLASARVFLGSGTAILCTPLLLGWASDQIGIEKAYGIVLVLLVLALAVTYVNSHFASPQND